MTAIEVPPASRVSRVSPRTRVIVAPEAAWDLVVRGYAPMGGTPPLDWTARAFGEGLRCRLVGTPLQGHDVGTGKSAARLARATQCVPVIEGSSGMRVSTLGWTLGVEVDTYCGVECFGVASLARPFDWEPSDNERLLLVVTAGEVAIRLSRRRRVHIRAMDVLVSSGHVRVVGAAASAASTVAWATISSREPDGTRPRPRSSIL